MSSVSRVASRYALDRPLRQNASLPITARTISRRGRNRSRRRMTEAAAGTRRVRLRRGAGAGSAGARARGVVGATPSAGPTARRPRAGGVAGRAPAADADSCTFSAPPSVRLLIPSVPSSPAPLPPSLDAPPPPPWPFRPVLSRGRNAAGAIRTRPFTRAPSTWSPSRARRAACMAPTEWPNNTTSGTGSPAVQELAASAPLDASARIDGVDASDAPAAAAGVAASAVPPDAVAVGAAAAATWAACEAMSAAAWRVATAEPPKPTLSCAIASSGGAGAGRDRRGWLSARERSRGAQVKQLAPKPWFRWSSTGGRTRASADGTPAMASDRKWRDTPGAPLPACVGRPMERKREPCTAAAVSLTRERSCPCIRRAARSTQKATIARSSQAATSAPWPRSVRGALPARIAAAAAAGSTTAHAVRTRSCSEAGAASGHAGRTAGSGALTHGVSAACTICAPRSPIIII
eukprot:scaffold18513_cov101-Isochrysis_galbana.AAC.3